MDCNKICFVIILVVIIFIFSLNFGCDTFKTEKYTPSIVRYLPCTEDKNTCKFPYTNNTQDTTCNNDVYIYQYGNRKILNPDQYMKLIKKLLNDLSTKKVDVSKLNDKMLKEVDYDGDINQITNFINSEINKLVNTKKYLQNNGNWKYEYFSSSEPTIYFYEVSNNSKLYDKLPKKFHLFKILYTLANTLRSSYTRCLAFITVIDGKLNIEYTSIVNDFEKTIEDNIKVIPTEALNFTFIDTIANNDFDQYGNNTDYSGLNYISEFREGTKVNIKADIPQEFKKENFEPQYLPPLFGNGICKYPPYYKTENGKTVYFNSPPLY